MSGSLKYTEKHFLSPFHRMMLFNEQEIIGEKLINAALLPSRAFF
jgi:hypothetical protein